ncbi:Uncharacterised protein [Bartonella grahamii]|uniref:Uncharacterized protein n=1 Tax=Bartonella grahamii TaxID=33045 RepID=A0A336NEP0_BARGR|nr:Uncharacterised protein [Bartonella grahamii]
MCEYTTTSVFRLGRSVKTMRHLHFHYLEDIALNTFENRKAKLKENGKVGNWFLSLHLHILPQ